jgi:hypothetical protein
MRGVVLALSLLAAAVRDAAAAELGFVYVRANVGAASGGHAALLAGDTVYHLQTDGDGLYRIARDRFTRFAYVYADLQNRPLQIAHVEVTPEARERVVDRFARLYVEQDLEDSRRESLASDVAWLEAWAEGRPPPPLRMAGLLDPDHPADPDALRLRDELREPLEAAQRALAAKASDASPADLEALRDRLALGEALRALTHAFSLAPEALVRIPARFDDPLTDLEKRGLEAYAGALAQDAAALLRSSRPDRGYALLLIEARYIAVRRSLVSDRLVLLDAFAGHGGEAIVSDEPAGERTRAAQTDHAGTLLRRGRALVLEGGSVGESTYNLLEEAAGLLARTEAGRPDTALLDLERRKVPSRARGVATPRFPGDVRSELAAARARLAAAETRYREHWRYDLISRNCITELARTSEEALAGRVSADEAFGFIPFVFFDRVRERAPGVWVEDVPSHRERELARLEREEPGVWTRLRESTSLGSEIYTPRRQDGAFLLFTDDVFWRRPLYGVVNLAWAAGYTAYGVVAAPFDFGARAKAGLSGMFWSVPELAFENVRKGSFEWVTTGD